MKGPKDSKESHTSVTMEGTAGVGRVRSLLCAWLNYRALCVPGAGGEGGVWALWDAGGGRQPPSPCPALVPARGRAGSRAERPELRRSRAEPLRGGRDGCGHTGLPWKSSSSSGSAVAAAAVRPGPAPGRGALSVPGGGGCVGLCRLRSGASLFRARFNHLGSGTRGPVWGQKELGWAGLGDPGLGDPLCPGCAAGMVMGRGPHSPQHRGAGMSVTPWLGGEAPGIPGGTRGPLLLPCAGTAPPEAPRSFSSACSDGSSRVHPSCGSRVVQKGGTLASPPLSRSRVLV